MIFFTMSKNYESPEYPTPEQLQQVNRADDCAICFIGQSGFMIACDHCNRWFHGACLIISEEYISTIDVFYCMDCLAQNEHLAVVFHKPNHSSPIVDPSTDHVLTEASPEPCFRLEKETDRLIHLPQTSSMDPSLQQTPVFPDVHHKLTDFLHRNQLTKDVSASTATNPVSSPVFPPVHNKLAKFLDQRQVSDTSRSFVVKPPPRQARRSDPGRRLGSGKTRKVIRRRASRRSKDDIPYSMAQRTVECELQDACVSAFPDLSRLLKNPDPANREKQIIKPANVSEHAVLVQEGREATCVKSEPSSVSTGEFEQITFENCSGKKAASLKVDKPKKTTGGLNPFTAVFPDYVTIDDEFMKDPFIQAELQKYLNHNPNGESEDITVEEIMRNMADPVLQAQANFVVRRFDEK